MTLTLFTNLTFAQTLRAFRGVARMKQEDLADYLGYGLSTIYDWEAEKREPKDLTKDAILAKLEEWRENSQ